MEFTMKNNRGNNSREDLIMSLKKSFDKAEDAVKNEIKDINQFWNYIPSDTHKNGRYPNEVEIARTGGKFLVCRANGELYIDTFLKEREKFGPKSSFIVIEENNPVVKWMNLPDANID